MFANYVKTELELIIEDIYKRNDMWSPADLTLRNLEAAFNIKVKFLDDAPNRAIWDDDFAVVFLNPKQSVKEIRSVFFHEIGHPFRHVGSQEQLPDLFRHLQETQANQFLLYAAIPFYMFEELEKPLSEHEFINLIEETFLINRDIAVKRLEQIRNRVRTFEMDNKLKEREKHRYRKASTMLSPETIRILNQLNKQISVNKDEVKI
ncbi:ImmA/IrrE family metallo-endopeptidase [Cytobacillus gottheilii]|uniref:ImmA/IrrE family metallo-endopeptidase n=1 Tax=Cytobacillus gottheilii TaxID=859144 RepID=A0ABX8F9D2_9BACI|nr:ImmA/IrrE family metallo-endopeptidase [Cytobacillus gottheilii]QVY60974.1 ImmA/IrrE family metallo-endopeptidase [Cytobacillus gottheilii]